MANDIVAQSSVQKFKPTPNQQKWLDKAIELLTDSPSVISDKSEQSRTNWYTWLEQPGFEDWFYTNYRLKRRRIIPSLDAMGMYWAKKGSYNHWKDMNAKAGDSTEQTQVNVQFNKFEVINQDGEPIPIK